MKRAFAALVSAGMLSCGTGETSGNPPGERAGRSRSGLVCPPSPAPGLMKNAVCVCESLGAVGFGITTRAPAGQTADVGINRAADVVGHFEVAGSFRAHDGIKGVGTVEARDDIVTFGNLDGVGAVSAGNIIAVKGNLTDVGRLSAKTIEVGGTVSQVGMSPSIKREAFNRTDSLPCDCGGLDVAAKVAQAKDDASVKKLGDSQSVGESSTELTTGSYYLESLSAVGQAELSIKGAVALYVSGSINLVGNSIISVPKGSTLDLYIAKNLSTVGSSITQGDAEPGAVRLYVGGDYQSVGSRELTLSLYAPNANVSWVGNTTIHGSVLAKTLSSVGSIDVDYAAPAAPADGTCEPSDGGIAEGPGTGGGSGGGDGSGGSGGGDGSGNGGGQSGSGGGDGTGGSGGSGGGSDPNDAGIN